ncbi:MAG: hypothetical protein WCE49_18880, partial [Terrimicrobiaceae bacterium]
RMAGVLIARSLLVRAAPTPWVAADKVQAAERSPVNRALQLSAAQLHRFPGGIRVSRNISPIRARS